jgi:hypothetical protein
MIAVPEIKRLAERGDIVMRRAAMLVFFGGLLKHAVPNGHAAALCGFIPASGEWLDEDTVTAPPRTCRRCHEAMQRAGFAISFSGRISPAERAS